MSEEQIQPQKVQTDSANKGGQPPEKPPIVPVSANEIKPPKIPDDPQTDKKKRKRKPLSCFEFWMVVLSGIGILVAGGTGAAIVWQDIIANASLVELQKQDPEVKISADAAKSAADTAKDALHLSERAYIVFSAPQIDAAKKSVSLQFANAGRIPSGAVTVTTHEATFNLDIPGGKTQFTKAIEKSWESQRFPTINPTAPMSILIPSPEMVPARIKAGLQLIVIAGYTRYTDGFPGTPVETDSFCTQTLYSLVAKDVYLSPCDAVAVIPQMEAVDGYPNNEKKN